MDEVVLVHADNSDAIFCAEVIHEILRNTALESEGKMKKLLEDVTIADELWKIDDLDACEPSKFGRALECLWKKDFPARIPFSDTKQYFLNITGGYKPLIALFACIGYCHNLSSINLFYLNEEAGKDILVMGFNTDDPGDSGLGLLKASQFDIEHGQMIWESISPLDI